MGLFLRSFVQEHFADTDSSLYPSLLATLFSTFNSILADSILPHTLLHILDDAAWFFLRHQTPSNDLLYNEIFQFRVVIDFIPISHPDSISYNR